MGQVTESTPFAGAKTCYTRAYRLLDWMGRNGYVNQTRNSKGKTIRCHPSEEMSSLIAALNRADESTIKAFLLDQRFFDACH